MKKRWFTPSFDASSINVLSKKHPKNVVILQNNNSRNSKSLASSSSLQCIDILDRYQPKIVADLAVHPKKIKELETWLRDFISSSHLLDKKYLLLLGPNGCGKTSAFRIIAQSLDVHVIEWITPLDRDFFMSGTSCDSDCIFQNSAFDLFDDFLWHASRYGGSLISSMRKIILIKDFPHVFYRNPESFHNLVKKYYNLKTYPFIFICNDDNLGRSLFPDVIRKECDIHTILFNPISCTSAIKALKRVVELKRQSDSMLKTPSMADLRNICEISNGDLRSALLKLHFNMIQPCICDGDDISYHRDMIPDESTRKDQLLDLFKLLGRVLFSKRIAKSCTNDYAFFYSPDEIVTTVIDRSFSFVGFLEENYISRFSNIISIAHAASKFSTFDVMSKQCDRDIEATALAFIVRSVMTLNSQPKKSFAPFNKPKFHNQTTASELSRSIRYLFPRFQLPSAELVMYVLPFLKDYSLSTTYFNDSQLTYINALLTYSKFTNK